MANIAYDRLSELLQHLSPTEREPLVRDTAAAMLDAWSIVDSAHRLVDLVENLPGLPSSTWRRLLRDRTADVAALRNKAQHQLGEIDGLVAQGGQLWGYLSWAEVQSGKYTGKWLMIAAGSDYVGDQWFFMGPASVPFDVPSGRIRLNAFGAQVYLGRTVAVLNEGIVHLSDDIVNARMRAVGEPATERRGADAAMEGYIEVLYSVASPASDDSSTDSSAEDDPAA